MGLKKFFKKKDMKELTDRDKQELYIRNTVKLKSYRQYRTFKKENRNFSIMLHVLFVVLGIVFITALFAYIINLKRSNYYSPEIHEVFGEADRANDFVSYTQDMIILILFFGIGFMDFYKNKFLSISRIFRYAFYIYGILILTGFLTFPFTSYEMGRDEKILNFIMGFFMTSLCLVLYIKGYFTGFKRIGGLFSKTYPKVFIVSYVILIPVSLYLILYNIYAFNFKDFPF